MSQKPKRLTAAERTRILAEILHHPQVRRLEQMSSESAEASVVRSYLDLVVEYGTSLRWRTTIANDRPDRLNWLVQQPGVLALERERAI